VGWLKISAVEANETKKKAITKGLKFPGRKKGVYEEKAREGSSLKRRRPPK